MSGIDTKTTVFVPNTTQLTKDITAVQSQDEKKKLSKAQEELQTKVKSMADHFAELLQKHPHGDATPLINPGCNCHTFDPKHVLSSWSYPLDKNISAYEIPDIKNVCKEYEQKLNETLKWRRYLVFLGTKVVYYYYDGTDNSTYKGSIYFVLKKDTVDVKDQ